MASTPTRQRHAVGAGRSLGAGDERERRRQNNSRDGLGAGVWTSDIGRAFRMSERLESGMRVRVVGHPKLLSGRIPRMKP
jgi:hypothetical protein